MSDNIRDFLDDMYGSVEGRVSVWWRAMPGSKSPYSKSRWFSWPAEADKMVDFIESISDKDVCVTTSAYSEDRRIPEHATKTNMIWMDSDTCNGDNYRVAPTWTVVSSPGRWQHHWVLDAPVPTTEASELVHRISIAHDHQGADQSSWPVNKIVRVPGTANTSHGFPTTVRATTTGEIHSIHDLRVAYEDVQVPERALVRDIPQLNEAELPDYGTTLAKLPSRLLELVTDEPNEGQDRSRLRYKMLVELFRGGYTYEEVICLAWHAPSARKWNGEDPRGLEGLQMEAVKARVEALAPNPDPVDPFTEDTDDVVELAFEKPVVILTDEEREVVKANPCFVDQYVALCRKRLPHDNDAYDRLNAWIIMSLVYSDAGFIPSPGHKTPLNLFGMTLGETTTGKTSSFKQMRAILAEAFHDDPGYDIGGNASESSLLKNLHNRDGRTSFFNKDEAHGVLKAWATQEWTAGIRETIAELYEGSVPPILRSRKEDSHASRSDTKFVVHMMGTNKAMFEGLTQDMFASGFLPRFIWAIGKPRKITFDSLAPREMDNDVALSDFDPDARKFAMRLRENRDIIRQFYGGSAPIRLQFEAGKRLQVAAYEMLKQYEGTRMWDMLQPSIMRWKDSVHKAACLVAMDNQRVEVTLEDMLIALNAGEEWFTNLLRVMSQVSSSDFERSCDEIERFVNSKGGRVTERALFSKFRGIRGPYMKEYMESLFKQGRVVPVIEGRGVNERQYYKTPLWRDE